MRMSSYAALPVGISSFVGRVDELSVVTDLIGRHRLVTLVGSGGTGKTRLLVEALLARSGDVATAFVPLEPVRNGTQLHSVVAAALDIRDRSQTLSSDVLADALGERAVRLVLDGAEHLAEDVRDLAGRLLSAAPGLRVVVTSRRLLGVAGEVSWSVPQLSVAAAEPGGVPDAVQLFLTRARERVPGLEPDPAVVTELCRRLGGLPLAIELTAAWTGTLTVEQILRERADLLSVGGGLGSVLDGSWELLTEGERDLLAALSVFAGEFTLEDARSVADLPTAVFAERLRGLVDSSWLVVLGTQERSYSMLESVRSYGRDRLDATPHADAVRRRHAERFGAIAAESQAGLAGAELAQWLPRMRAADADIQDALRWARDSGEVDFGLAMAASLWRWWLAGGQLTTGRRWLGLMLEANPDRRDAVAGRALSGAAILAAENGDPADAVGLAERALAILQQLDEVSDAALAATVLGSAQRYLGDETGARANLGVALALRRRLGDRRGESASLNNLALLCLDSADLDGAGKLLGEALAIKRTLGEPRAIALGLCNLSEVFVRTGRLDDAERAIAEAMTIATDLDDKQLLGGLLCNTGDLAAHRGDWRAATRYYEDALRAHGEAGNEHDEIVAYVGLGRALHHLGRPDEAVRQLRRAEGMAERTGNMQRLAYVRVALADVLGTTRSGAVPSGLTARQAEVLRHLAAGMSNREIAERLHLSVATVERHLATVYRNLDLPGRVAAARYAMEHGLLSM
jgi:predicted ATPase/DNA-binding CsgD family transcriptional regulator